MFQFARNWKMGWYGWGWVQALKACLPKSVNEMLNMKQKQDSIWSQGQSVIRDLQWNNMEMEVETIPDCVFRFWDQKDLKERLSEFLENSLFLSNLEFKNQGIIHLLTAMWKIRCKMISIQNEEKARKFVNFLIQDNDGTIRKALEKNLWCV